MANQNSNSSNSSGGFSLFGQAPTNGAQSSSNLFGQNTQTTTSGNSSPAPTTFGGGGQSNIFGGATGQFGASSPGTNAFGGGQGGGGQSVFFGGSTGQPGGSNSSTSVFGGGGGGGQSNLFGGGTGQSGGSGTSGNLFGGASVGNTGFAFGKPSEQKQEANSSSAFTGFSTPNKSNTTTSSTAQGQTQSLFGSLAPSGTSTPTTSKPTFSFANTSTTPAGPPPSTGSLFNLGQSDKTSSNNLFGSVQSTSNASEQASKPPASSIFGSIQTSSATQPAESSSQNPTAGNSAFNLFGKATETSSSQAPQDGAKPNLFSSPAPSAQQSTSFGAGTQVSKPDDSGANKPAFSFPSAAATSGQTPDQTAPASAATDKPNIFGSATSGSSSASGLFSNPSQSKDGQQSSTTSALNLFGNNNAQRGTQENAPQQPSALFGEITKKENDTSTTKSQEALATATAASAPSTTPAVASNVPTAIGAPMQGSAATSQNQPEAAGTGAGVATGATMTSSTAGPPPTAQSRLKNRSMDEIITRWASDLSKYQKEFQAQAEKIAQWDRMLLENGNAISKLYSKTFQAERDTAEVQKQLSIVEGHQDELSHWLDRYEKEVDEMMARQVGQGEGLQGPDQERERTYKIAERVSERLDDMGKDLTSMIEEINETSTAISKTSKPDDPLSQIVRVLNGHLSQLQTIDQGAAALQAKVSAAQKETQRLGSRNRGSFNSAADDFYRSYMGRGGG